MAKKFSRCTVFCVFFSAASCKKRYQKLCTWEIFCPFLFCLDFSPLLLLTSKYQIMIKNNRQYNLVLSSFQQNRPLSMIIYLISLLMSTFEIETPAAIFVISHFEKVKNFIKLLTSLLNLLEFN